MTGSGVESSSNVTSRRESESSIGVTAPAAPITAIVCGYKRIPALLATLKRISSCSPPPAEILLHVDDGQEPCAAAVQTRFPDVRLLVSPTCVGPGGGRNRLIAEARHELVASFDDDSYPVDDDFFARAADLCERFPNAAIIGGLVYERGHEVHPDVRQFEAVADFPGGGCIYRKSTFLSTTGFLPLAVAYGAEEVDLAIRLHAAGQQILRTRWLRVFHDTDLSRHSVPAVSSASIANIALVAFLRYPAAAWPLGAWQCLRRATWLIARGRGRGVMRGFLSIPRFLNQHKQLRAPIPLRSLWSYLMLRRHPTRVEL